VAQDGSDADSPFTKALVQTIQKPGLDIFRAFNEIGLIVARTTGGEQQPWLALSPITGDFYFSGSPAAPAAATAQAGNQQVKTSALKSHTGEVSSQASPPRSNITELERSAADESAWSQAVKVGTVASFNNYLTTYPTGAHSGQAQHRLADLGAPPTPQRSTILGAGPFDGKWITQVDCPKAGTAGAFSILVDADVMGGVFHGEKGDKGKAGWFSLDGKVRTDGVVELVARGIVNSRHLAAGNVPVGTEYGYRVSGRLKGSEGNGERVGGRFCKVTFSK
jgi:hypothetical protein